MRPIEAQRKKIWIAVTWAYLIRGGIYQIGRCKFIHFFSSPSLSFFFLFSSTFVSIQIIQNGSRKE